MRPKGSDINPGLTEGRWWQERRASSYFKAPFGTTSSDLAGVGLEFLLLLLFTLIYNPIHMKSSPVAFQELTVLKLSHCSYHTSAMILKVLLSGKWDPSTSTSFQVVPESLLEK